MIKVLFVCHGNICRSTMAESVFADMINKANLSDKFVINSAATSTEEIGNPPHHGTVKKLKELGIPLVPHFSTQITKQDMQNFDHIIAMDDMNVKNIEKVVGFKSQKVRKLLSFAGSNADIADPWYSGDFDATYRDIKIGLDGFLKELKI